VRSIDLPCRSALLAGTLAALAGAGSAGEDEPAARPDLWRLVERIAEESGFREDVDAIVHHLEEVVKQRAAPNRPSRVARGLAEPWSVPEIAEEIRQKLSMPFAAAGNQPGAPRPLVRWDGFVEAVASLCDLSLEIEEPEAWSRVSDPSVTGADLVSALSELAASLNEAARAGLGRIGDERRAELAQSLRRYAEIDWKTHDPKVKATADEEKLQSALVADLWKTRLGPTLSAAAIAVRLADPTFLASLPDRLKGLPRSPAAEPGFSGDVVAVFGDTAATRVVIGGKGKTSYNGAAAIIIDLGGDDTYARAAVVDDPEALVSIVLDLGGNDVYLGERGGPAHACGGIALLVDVSGKDVYRGGRLSLGSAAMGGFALLADYAGNDTYESEGYAQGYAFGAVGLLYDRAGNDRYDGWGYAQGSTQGWGLGVLVDWDGNDVYLADLRFADSYGDSGPNVYHGGSQGSSFGLRPAVPGGIAALIDQQGKDDYQAGNFSQGGGYYLGFGLMFDGGGDDKNVGARYSQGYGVHQAIGMRWDRGGNDSYSTRVAANLGAAWDEGVGYFIDEGGDDVYSAGGLSLGGAANTAVAVFLDGGGKDRYTSPAGLDSQGGTGDSSYHKKQSLGVLIDLGGSKDSYSRAGRKDGILTWQRWYGLFLDASETSPAKVLQRKPGRLEAAETAGRDT
jgi:hypothetical protein